MKFSPTVSLRACYDKPRPYIDQSMLIPNGHGCLILEKHPYEVLFVSDFSAPCQGLAPLCPHHLTLSITGPAPPLEGVSIYLNAP